MFLQNILPESQCSFSPNRGRIDMIFTARMARENYRDQHLVLCNYFIDMTKAFDPVHWLTILCILLKTGCQVKIIGFIRSLHENIKVCFCFNGELLETIPFGSQVQLTVILAETLFAIFFFAIVFMQAFSKSNAGIHIDYSPFKHPSIRCRG